MAQNSTGIKVYVGTATRTSLTSPWVEPKTWQWVPDVTAIPALGGEPNMIDITPLDETVQHRYIAGLKDPGGAFGYTVLFTEAMISVTTPTATPVASDGLSSWAFCVEFPAPLDRHYWYVGQGVECTPDETEVDVALTTTFYTSIESEVYAVDGPAPTTATP